MQIKARARTVLRPIINRMREARSEATQRCAESGSFNWGKGVGINMDIHSLNIKLTLPTTYKFLLVCYPQLSLIKNYKKPINQKV